LPKLRERIAKKYPIRHYPDITHSLSSQFPVPDWDLAFSQTEAREVITRARLIKRRFSSNPAIYHRFSDLFGRL
jgi:hypothetical protein